MRKLIVASIAGLAAIGVGLPALADTTTIVKKHTYETHDVDPTIVLTPDGIAVGSIDTERCTTKTVKKETENREVTKTTKRCR